MIPPRPILLVGGYGYRNVGDEAILAGMLARIGREGVTVVSRSPDESARMHGVDAIPIREALPALRRHRSVLIGGGGLFGRDMGRVGRLLPAFGLFAAALGRTVIIDGVDIDDDMPATTRYAVRQLARRAASVTVRDRRSQRLLEGWGIEAHHEPDRSYDMPIGDRSEGVRLLEAAGVDLARPVIGLCLTGVNSGLTESLAAAVAGLAAAMPHAQLCLIPMSRHPWVASHDDLHLATTLRSSNPLLRVMDTVHHPSVVLAALAELSAAICMRYHSVLFADRVGVPFVAVPYAAKVGRWMREGDIPVLPLTGVAWAEALRPAVETPGEPEWIAS